MKVRCNQADSLWCWMCPHQQLHDAGEMCGERTQCPHVPQSKCRPVRPKRRKAQKQLRGLTYAGDVYKDFSADGTPRTRKVAKKEKKA